MLNKGMPFAVSTALWRQKAQPQQPALQGVAGPTTILRLLLQLLLLLLMLMLRRLQQRRNGGRSEPRFCKLPWLVRPLPQ